MMEPDLSLVHSGDSNGREIEADGRVWGADDSFRIPEPEKPLDIHVATANAEVGRRRDWERQEKGGARHPGLGPTSQV